MLLPVRVRLALAIAGVSACAAVTGLSDYSVDPNIDASRDAATPDAPATRADVIEIPIDGAADACPGAAAPPAIMPAAHVARGAIVVDGHGDDWPCTTHVSFDRTTAQGTLNTNGARADIAMAWSDDGVYYLVRMESGRPPSAPSPDKPFFNDAVELFLGASPTQDSGLYREHDLQLIIDALNRLSTYRQNQPFDAGAGLVVAQASSDDVGFVVEAFIAAPAIGRPSLAAGDLSFDVMPDQFTDGGSQNAFWLYANVDASAPRGGCGAVISPSCSTLEWGTLRLVP